MSLIHTAVLGMAGFLGGEAPAIEFAGAGWYRAHLDNDQRLTLKVIEKRDDSFVCLYQGASLLVTKDHLKSLRRLGAEAAQAGSKAALPPHLEEKVRDALEELGSTDDQLVQRAYGRLRSEFKGCREILHDSLRHRSVRVRKLVVKLLGEEGEGSRDLPLVSPLLRDPDEKVRLAAVMAIRRLGPGAMDSILSYLRQEGVSNNRKMAVENLRSWKDDRAVEPLVGLLAVEQDRGVRMFMARALMMITGKDLGDDLQAWEEYLKESNHRKRLEASKPASETRSGSG